MAAGEIPWNQRAENFPLHFGAPRRVPTNLVDFLRQKPWVETVWLEKPGDPSDPFAKSDDLTVVAVDDENFQPSAYDTVAQYQIDSVRPHPALPGVLYLEGPFHPSDDTDPESVEFHVTKAVGVSRDRPPFRSYLTEEQVDGGKTYRNIDFYNLHTITFTRPVLKFKGRFKMDSDFQKEHDLIYLPWSSELTLEERFNKSLRKYTGETVEGIRLRQYENAIPETGRKTELWRKHDGTIPGQERTNNKYPAPLQPPTLDRILKRYATWLQSFELVSDKPVYFVPTLKTVDTKLYGKAIDVYQKLYEDGYRELYTDMNPTSAMAPGATDTETIKARNAGMLRFVRSSALRDAATFVEEHIGVNLFFGDTGVSDAPFIPRSNVYKKLEGDDESASSSGADSAVSRKRPPPSGDDDNPRQQQQQRTEAQIRWALSQVAKGDIEAAAALLQQMKL